MTSTAPRLDDGQAQQEIGTVARIEPDLVVSAASGRLSAARAVSCLVAPELDDVVLVAVSGAGQAWVLAVLERPSEGPTRVEVDGEVELRARGGVLRLEGDEGVAVRSRREVDVAAPRLNVSSGSVRAIFEHLAAAGGAAQIDLERVKSVVGFFDQVAERVSQTVKRSYRFVEEMEVLRAEQIDMRAEENLAVRSKNTLMSSDLLHKVDAGQIHLG